MTEICSAIVPAAPVRSEPSDASEMVTQLLYGEKCEILEVKMQWRLIRCMFDGYEGWVDEKQISVIKPQKAGVNAIVTSLFLLAKSDKNSQQILLSAGAEFLLVESNLASLYHNGAPFKIVEGSWLSASEKCSLPNILELSHKYINAPYLWGGRNAMGIDCSGLMQVLYKLLGIALPRDACEQVKVGNEVTQLVNAKPGDLAYFENEKGKVTHVGILLDSEFILHASGKVRIDELNAEGIYNKEIAVQTHKLKVIKRVVGL